MHNEKCVVLRRLVERAVIKDSFPEDSYNSVAGMFWI